jgi:hypothetical protein
LPIENKILNGLGIMLKGVLDYLKFVLQSNQLSSDYNPKENDTNDNYTEACIKVCDAIEKIIPFFNETLSGTNIESFFLELGYQFFQILKSQLKSLTISPIGNIKNKTKER